MREILGDEIWKYTEIPTKLNHWRTKSLVAEAKKSFLAGAIYGGMHDEDAPIVLKAFDKWAAESKLGEV